MKRTIYFTRLLLSAGLGIALVSGLHAQRSPNSRGTENNNDRGSREVRTGRTSEGLSNRRGADRQVYYDQQRNPSANSSGRNVFEQRVPSLQTSPRVSNNNNNNNSNNNRNEARTDRQVFLQRNGNGSSEVRRNDQNNQARNYGSANRSRNVYPQRNVYNNYNYNSRNNYAPRRYVYIGAPRYSRLPRTSLYINFGGYPYYYNDGLFYNYNSGYYQPVYAPFGIRIRSLPIGYLSFNIGPSRYFYHNGIYYQPSFNTAYNYNEYQVVEAPIGAQVYSLPAGAKAVVVNGEKFYEFNGTYYRADRDSKGRNAYTVAGKYGEIDNTPPPIDSNQEPLNTPNLPQGSFNFREGDIVPKLPDGSKTVTINGQQLFLSPDDVYFKLQYDGNNVSYIVVGLPSDNRPVKQKLL